MPPYTISATNVDEGDSDAPAQPTVNAVSGSATRLRRLQRPPRRNAENLRTTDNYDVQYRAGNSRDLEQRPAERHDHVHGHFRQVAANTPC